MFPTHVGMNRPFFASVLYSLYVPHTRGDEPRMEQTVQLTMRCSPHTWG